MFRDFFVKISLLLLLADKTAMEKELFIAAKNNDIEKIESLFSNGVDINVKDFVRDTPLHFAASKGNLEATITLINCGADFQACNIVGDKPKDCAKRIGKSKIVSYLNTLQ